MAAAAVVMVVVVVRVADAVTVAAERVALIAAAIAVCPVNVDGAAITPSWSAVTHTSGALCTAAVAANRSDVAADGAAVAATDVACASLFVNNGFAQYRFLLLRKNGHKPGPGGAGITPGCAKYGRGVCVYEGRYSVCGVYVLRVRRSVEMMGWDVVVVKDDEC